MAFFLKALVSNSPLMKKQFSEWHPNGARNISRTITFREIEKLVDFCIAEPDNARTLKSFKW